MCPKARCRSLTVWSVATYVVPHLPRAAAAAALPSKQMLVRFIGRVKLKGTQPISLYYGTDFCGRSLIFNFQQHVKELEKSPISLNLGGGEDYNFINTRGLCLYLCPTCVLLLHMLELHGTTIAPIYCYFSPSFCFTSQEALYLSVLQVTHKSYFL